MQKKVAKWQEPPPAKQTKVLPAPDMEPKKRRGGRRARKYKERYGLTDVKKVRSRLGSGDAPLPRSIFWLCRGSVHQTGASFDGRRVLAL
jgi:hypothetical protein